MCLFPCLHGAGKAVLGLGCGVGWDKLLLNGFAIVTSNAHQNDVFSRALFPARSICPPSGHPPWPIQV